MATNPKTNSLPSPDCLDEQNLFLLLMKVADPSTRCRSVSRPWRPNELSSSRVKVGRPLVSPNPTFQKVLVTFMYSAVNMYWFAVIVVAVGLNPGLI